MNTMGQRGYLIFLVCVVRELCRPPYMFTVLLRVGAVSYRCMCTHLIAAWLGVVSLFECIMHGRIH